MSALSAILRLAVGNRHYFWCPGCNGVHGIQFGEGDGPRWNWNGNAEKPTYTPSLLVRRDWHDANGQESHQVCHSFITDGQIQFLSDCTHALAGQTVPIPEWPRHYGDDE